MKQIWKKILGLGGILSGAFCAAAFAKTGEEPDAAGSEQTSSATTSPSERSAVYDSLSVSISNSGKGGIGIYAQALMFVDVKWIKLELTLQRYEETETSFHWVDELTINETYTNTHEAVYSDVLYGYPTGYYYRLRGIGDIPGESKATVTDGVMITAKP